METEGVIASPPSSHLTAAAVGHMTKLLPKGCSTHGEAVALPSCAGAMWRPLRDQRDAVLIWVKSKLEQREPDPSRLRTAKHLRTNTWSVPFSLPPTFLLRHLRFLWNVDFSIWCDDASQDVSLVTLKHVITDVKQERERERETTEEWSSWCFFEKSNSSFHYFYPAQPQYAHRWSFCWL